MKQITVGVIASVNLPKAFAFIQANPGFAWVEGRDRLGRPYWRVNGEALAQTTTPEKGVVVKGWEWVEDLTSGGSTFRPYP